MTSSTPLPADWDDGDTLGAGDFNKVSARVNDIYTANADDLTRAVIEVVGAVILPAVAFTDYTVLLRAGAAPQMPTVVANTSRYTLKNTSAGPVTVTFTAGQLADGGPLVIGPYESVDAVPDPVTPNNPTAAWRIV